MVQEFNVLRCFFCKTFQVQQVKKSKKWSCKMCGEKQSLIKEYGRGTGADCRRHVQKLNALRGELHEVENKQVWTQWEEQEEEREVTVRPGDDTHSWQQKIVSRWSKYVVDQKQNEPESEEDEQEEKASVYTDQQRQHNNNSSHRKRKKSYTSRDTYRCYNDEEDQKRAVRQTEPRHHDATSDLSQVLRHSTGSLPTSIRRTQVLSASAAASLGSDCKSVYSNTPYSQFTAELSTKPQILVPLHLPSFSLQQLSETKLEAKDSISKWTRFLPSAFVADEEDCEEQAQCWDADLTASVQSPVMSVVLPNNTGHTSGEQKKGVEKGMVLENLSRCMTGNVPTSPSITSTPFGSQKPSCVQLFPKQASSFSSLFHTDEDFDDVY